MKKYTKFLLIVLLVINLLSGFNILEAYGLSRDGIDLFSSNLILNGTSENGDNYNHIFLISQKSEDESQTEAENKSSSPQLKQTAYPVILGQQELFSFSQPVGNISAEIRAKKASEAITKLAKNNSLNSDVIKVSKLSPQLVLLSTDDFLLFNLSEADAKAANTSLPELTNEYQEKVTNAIKIHRKDSSINVLLLRTLIAIALTFVFLFLIKLVKSITSWIYRKIETSEKSLLKNIRIQRLQLISRQQQKIVIVGALKVLIAGLYLLLFFTYIGFLFKIFPLTQKYGDVVFSAFKSAITSIFSAFLDYLPNLFTIGLTLFLTQYIIRFSNTFFRAIKEGKMTIPGFYQEWAEPTGRIMVLMIYAMALAIIFPYLPGADSPAFQGISLFLGALVTFGGASAISNVIGGIIVIYTRAYQIGDMVKVGDVLGNVLEKTILSTRIRTPNNQIVTIPNSTIVSSNIINYTATNRELKEPLIVYTTITLGYDIPWRKVHQILIDAALATSNVSHDFEPFVLQTGLNDFYVSYELKAYSALGLAPSKVPRLYSELHQNIQDKCNEADIEILSPHYSAIRDGSHITIPADYLSDDYQPPGFKIDR